MAFEEENYINVLFEKLFDIFFKFLVQLIATNF